MALLTGLPIREIQADRIEICRKFANLWQKVVVLKGSGTVVSTPDGKVWVSPVATSALAHAGSGDVLTGIIAGYLAQGLSAREAAVLGVGLHAKCAQVAVNEPGCEDSVLASDLVRCIPAAIAQLREIKSR
jgi:NAD(P)H-hydrate epimerase